MVAEYDDSGTMLRKFIYGPGIDEPLIMIIPAGQTNPGWYWYHYDGLGSVVALSDSSSSIVEAYSYDVFGAVTVHTDAGNDGIWLTGDDAWSGASQYGNPYRFTGRRYDEETGLYYYRARMYAPAIGRFLQTDPIGYADSMNLYQYCGNNPVNFVDPWGYSWDSAFRRLFSWQLGTAPSEEHLLPDSEEVDDMKYAPGVNAARRQFLREMAQRAEKGKPPKAERYDELGSKFGLRELIDAGPNSTRQMVGGYRIRIVPNADGTKTIILRNKLNMNSWALHLLPRYEKTTFPMGGAAEQIYKWTEPYGERGHSESGFGAYQRRYERTIFDGFFD